MVGSRPRDSGLSGFGEEGGEEESELESAWVAHYWESRRGGGRAADVGAICATCVTETALYQQNGVPA